MPKDIMHYGTPRHSGRYPWGSGEDPQHNRSFLQQVEDMRSKGLTPKQIADGMNMTIEQLRSKTTIEKAEKRKADSMEAWKLKEKGYSNSEIGRRMGRNESSVRALLEPTLKERLEILDTTSNILKESVEKKGYIDVGVGVERYMGISRPKLKAALLQLQEEGYTVHPVQVEQLGTGKKTSLMVLAKPGTPYTEVYQNRDKIRMITDYSEDGGRSFLGLEPIRSVRSDRVKIRYAEEGGIDKDGLIELRRGVADISLGNAKYAQVRIGVDGSHYMKGMAIYSDDLPKGIDMIYNTNKSVGTPKEKVFKEMKKDKDGNIDPDNPFGASVRQKHYNDLKGDKQLSALNIVNEEGEWSAKWSKSLSSQMLSKQSPALAKKQLGLAYDIKKEEFDEIISLTNPVVKKRLLDSFADDCDSAAVHLKAAALPRTGWHVILPFPEMKETEIYAPNYKNGDKVVLIRYPHGGTFEIPELTVNNKNPKVAKSIGQAKDGVGINAKVAERLSGADFDGDTVLVIPNNNRQIKTSARLKGLIDFDPKTMYKPYDGMITIDGGVYNEKTGKVDYGGKRPRTQTKQMKMGDVSNLITDMTIRGGATNFDDIERAIKHSMVVIDAEKHHLDYKRSYVENGIAALKKKYQGSERSGASTLISKSSSEKRVDMRKLKTNTKKMTSKELEDYKSGKKVWEYTGETYVGKNGKIIKRTMTSTKMAEEEDAFKLSSGTLMEAVYATHANKLKGLANESRKASINTESFKYSPSAKEAYASEVSSLKAKLNIALKNAPLERQAQVIANAVVAAKRADNPDMDGSDLKKIKGQALTEARLRTNAKKQRVEITDREWEAIQAGAISRTTLSQILSNTDLDRVKQLATPRTVNGLSPAKQERIKLMLAAGHTQADIADALGVSTSAINKLMN
jgi:DNA-binding CsgD family transcriptional regulator